MSTRENIRLIARAPWAYYDGFVLFSVYKKTVVRPFKLAIW